MGSLHYLSCFCSQPVWLRCSQWIWRIFRSDHYVPHMTEMAADSEPISQWANDLRTFQHLPLMMLPRSTRLPSKCLWDPQWVRSFPLCINWCESCLIHHSNLRVTATELQSHYVGHVIHTTLAVIWSKRAMRSRLIKMQCSQRYDTVQGRWRKAVVMCRINPLPYKMFSATFFSWWSYFILPHCGY